MNEKSKSQKNTCGAIQLYKDGGCTNKLRALRLPSRGKEMLTTKLTQCYPDGQEGRVPGRGVRGGNALFELDSVYTPVCFNFFQQRKGHWSH